METKKYNVGTSNYSTMNIQPWDVWQDWNLNPWDADIVKRVARTKVNMSKSLQNKLLETGMISKSALDSLLEADRIDSRIEDYEKIIHICQERIKQLTNLKENKDGKNISNKYV